MMSDGWVHRAARELLDELELNSLPIDPFQIARQLDIVVEPMPSRMTCLSGILLRQGNRFAIAYATHIDNEGFQRFSVGHELGHFRLPGHFEAVMTTGMHKSVVGFRSDDRYEKEADAFAAGLLMPEHLVRPRLGEEPGLEDIEAIQALCRTSLTSTAIRYTQLTDEPVAVIISRGMTIEFSFLSQAFREIEGLSWLRKGTPIPRATATRRLAENPSKIKSAARDDDETRLDVWFEGGPDCFVGEEVVGLGGYGRTLTVLTPELEDEEDEDSEWEEPTLHRSRRKR